MSKVLGLSFFFHDSSAALVIDGRVVAAATEERFCRRKHTSEFPKQAIDYCLEAGNLSSINDLDAIVYYEKPVVKLQRIVETLVAVWPRGLFTFVRRLPHYISLKFNVYKVIENMLPGYRGRILFTDHHLSHAAAAFYCSPFDEAAILTIDGVGEWETTTMGVGRGREITLDRAIRFPHSIGLLYSALTSYLGFRVNDGEWKVMGLAPYGQPRYVEQFRQLVRTDEDGGFALDMSMFVHHYSSKWTTNDQKWEELFGFPRRDPKEDLEQRHEDLARSGQAVVEELILGLARAAQRASGSKNLVIAGGVGLNSVANWRIEKEGIFDNVWIQPAAGDDGSAIGAALLVSQGVFDDPPSPELDHVYLGPEISDEDTQAFLQRNGIAFEALTDDELVERSADLIAAGQVIGWFRGRMEFGPRALGARSILADATNPDMKAIVNTKIKYREYFRPFAPAIPADEVHEYFEVAPGTRMPFMLKVPKVRPDKRAAIPAVTHEDGTGRVQTVTEDDNPAYYRLLKAVKKRTGVPVLLNTSFNVRGEPIVCSLEDAWNCFTNTGIDALVLGNCLVTDKPDLDIDFDAQYAQSDELESRIGSEANVTDGQEAPRIEVLTMGAGAGEKDSDTTTQVLEFYKELPFNFYSNAIDTAVELARKNRVREYPALHAHLSGKNGRRMIDVGCGAGWFVNSCAHNYDVSIKGIDLNPVVLRQARSVARLMEGCETNEFLEANVFEYEPGERFDVVNSLGVLHHTPDCHGAIRAILPWVAPGGYLHLGLYHMYGRRPFLQHFANMQAQGATDAELYAAFARLNPEISDATHMRSWYRDQVLHPHETQHSYEEISALLEAEGFAIEATSINRFKAMRPTAELAHQEKTLEARARKALSKGRYFPGFFVIWARAPS